MTNGPTTSNNLGAACQQFGRPDDMAKAEAEVLDFDAPYDSDDHLQSADSQEETEVEKPLARTASQLTKQRQVENIRDRLAERQESVQQLKTALAALVGDALPEDADAAQKALDDERKRARNYGEDLVQDMLSLDKLSGLVAEDRASRKAAIAVIEALLDDVDSCKSQIKTLEGKVAELQSRVESAEEQAAAQQASVQATPLRSARATAPHSARAATQIPSARSFGGPEMPSAELWSQLPLQLRLRAREEEDRYMITVPAEGLTADDVSLQLDEDQERLTIRIFRQPRTEEAAAMQKRVAAHLRQLAMRSPTHLEQIRTSMDVLAANAYARLGQGVFGLFEKSVEIPEDVDTDSLQSSCTNGVLRMVLPKVARRPAPRPGMYGEGFPTYAARRPGYPQRHYARPQGLPQHQFFGGYPF